MAVDEEGTLCRCLNFTLPYQVALRRPSHSTFTMAFVRLLQSCMAFD